MAIIKCKECDAALSSDAEACPSCGAPGKRRSGITASRLVFDSGLIVLASSLTFVITSYQSSKQQGAWEQQQRVLYNIQLHSSKIALMERMQKQTVAFRHSGYDYTYTLAGYLTANEPGPWEEDGKASAYYQSLAELRGQLAVAPFFFSTAIRPIFDQMNTYLARHEWAPMVRKPEFLKRQRAGAETDTLMKLVNRTIRLDQYDILSDDLAAAMARDISDDINAHAILQRGPTISHPSIALELTGEIHVSKETVAVGELVEVEAEGHKGTGLYIYTWDIDDGVESHDRKVSIKFAQPGSKTVNLRIGALDPEDENMSKVVKWIFLRTTLTVTE